MQERILTLKFKPELTLYKMHRVFLSKCNLSDLSLEEEFLLQISFSLARRILRILRG